ncbi:hypothetical protein [Roseobacter sp. HKCCA0434]|uniref:hypothetical protein n=1 Tax=Roseobacter sp. HKCCA0434 TaxID=3079297 RepID=UPI002905F1E7|nr:hypothetical protein [Roseobacter sp. HKCCA0434]
MPKSFAVMSWNLERKSGRGFTTNERLADGIVDPIVTSLEEKGQERFVAYLMEFKGKPKTLEDVGIKIQTAYKQKTGRDLDVEITDLGGGSYTQESMITISDGLKVKSEPLGIGKRVEEKIEADVVLGKRRYNDFNSRRPLGKRAAAKKSETHRYGSEVLVEGAGSVDTSSIKTIDPVDRFRTNTRPASEFRDGLYSEVEFEGQTFKIVSAHAPGPKVTKEFPGVVEATFEEAAERQVDFVIGDFNTRGSIKTDAFRPTIAKRNLGTTFKAKDRRAGKQVLGTSKWDRAMPTTRDIPFKINVADPVISGAAGLTDHARIEAEVTLIETPPTSPQVEPASPTEPFPSSATTTQSAQPLASPSTEADPFTAAGKSSEAAAGGTPFDAETVADPASAALEGGEAAGGEELTEIALASLV